jgi:hypothetical protein
MTPGIMVNRPDLSDDAVLQSIAERNAMNGRHDLDPASVLSAALSGDADARGIVDGLVLPPPAAPLSMHPQPLLREARSLFPRIAPFAWARRGEI